MKWCCISCQNTQRLGETEIKPTISTVSIRFDKHIRDYTGSCKRVSKSEGVKETFLQQGDIFELWPPMGKEREGVGTLRRAGAPFTRMKAPTDGKEGRWGQGQLPGCCRCSPSTQCLVLPHYGRDRSQGHPGLRAGHCHHDPALVSGGSAWIPRCISHGSAVKVAACPTPASGSLVHGIPPGKKDWSG